MMKTNKSGFTLAEMLAVLALIAVLIAIAIPVFTVGVQHSREAVCAANCRSLRSLLSAEYLTENSEAGVEREFQAHKAEFVCPLGGEMYYEIQDDGVMVYCSHEGAKDALADKDKLALLNGYFEQQGLAKRQPFYNGGSSPEDIAKIRAGLAKSGVDLDDLSSWALRYDGGTYDKLYWTDKDLSGFNGKTVVMAYTLKTGNYTVWEATVQNGVIISEVNDSIKNKDTPQTYENALAIYKQLTA